MTAAAGEVPLFEAPDLGALKRNGPRIALRAAAALVIPTLVTWLARSLDFYGPIASLPLPLDFLRVGPFAYGAKVVWTLAFTFLVLAYLLPKRTSQLVMAICVGAVLWTGYLFTRLQWTRLFSDFAFLRWDRAPLSAWTFGALTLVAGAAFVAVEGWLETRKAQRERGIPADELDAVRAVALASLARAGALAAGGALALLGAYAGIRAMLAGERLPFRVDPVLTLLVMGIGLAVLVALALRPRPAVQGARPLPVARPARAVEPAAKEAPAAPSAGARWRELRAPERLMLAACALGALSLALPWQRTSFFGGGSYESWGVATPAGWALFGTAAGSAMAVLAGKPRVRRFAPLVFWPLSALLVAGAFWSAVGPESFAGQSEPRVGLFVATAAAALGTGLALWNARTRGES